MFQLEIDKKAPPLLRRNSAVCSSRYLEPSRGGIETGTWFTNNHFFSSSPSAACLTQLYLTPPAAGLRFIVARSSSLPLKTSNSPAEKPNSAEKRSSTRRRVILLYGGSLQLTDWIVIDSKSVRICRMSVMSKITPTQINERHSFNVWWRKVKAKISKMNGSSKNIWGHF